MERLFWLFWLLWPLADCWLLRLFCPFVDCWLPLDFEEDWLFAVCGGELFVIG